MEQTDWYPYNVVTLYQQLTYSVSILYRRCMSVPTAAVSVLRRAEAELRKLIQEALGEGRYQDVSNLAATADAVAQLHASTTDEEPAVGLQLHDEIRIGQRHGRRATGRAFPRFERDGDKLVKVAWSKRNRAEYEHRAPREVVEILIERIRKTKGEGAKFEASEILPLKDKGRDVPSYQAYLSIAWLRQEGVIVKYGREHYALKPDMASRTRVVELWEALPQK